MMFLARSDLIDLLLKSSILSSIVYQDNPKEYLENTPELRAVDHGIKEIFFSQTHGDKLEYFNKLNEIKYLIIKDDDKKRLFISFRGTQTLADVLDDAKIYSTFSDINGRFHNGFYKRAENIPINYFINKLVDGYQLILTGHSLGAAVAAMVTIKLLYLPDITQKYSNNITFIGYGCPSIADVYFKKENDAKYKDNFIFIKNQDDIVVEILEYVSYLVYEKKLNDDISTTKTLVSFMGHILPYIGGSLNLEKLKSICQQMLLVGNTLSKVFVPDYTHFGSLFVLNNNGLEKVNKFETDIENFYDLLNNPDKLMNKVQDHYISNYLRKLKDSYFQDLIDMKNRNRNLKVINLEDLKIKNLNLSEIKYNLNMYKSKHNTEIYLSIGYFENFEYLVAINFKLGQNLIYFDNKIEPLIDAGMLLFKFNCSNHLLYDSNGNHLHSSFIFQFYSHFNENPIEIKISSSNEIKKGSNPKQREIQNMPFDLLYLHAAYYIQAISRMESDTKNDIKNKEFISTKNELLAKFDLLDKILEEIWIEKYKKGYVYTENDKNEIKYLAIEYLEYLKIKNQEDRPEFIENLDAIEFENRLVGFRKHILNTINEKDGSKKLLKKIIPYLYEIKKRTCRISNLSEKLYDAICEESFRKIGSRYTNGLGLVCAVTALSAIALSHGLVVIPLALSAFGGVGVVEMGKAVYEYKTFYPNWNENELYKQILMQTIVIENIDVYNKTLGFFEKLYDQEFIDEWTEKSDKVVFRLININSQMRDVLSKNYIIGSIGTKKAGKSTFVELLTNQNANANGMVATTTTTAYSIYEKGNLKYDKIVVFDYPHSNSHSLSEKLEFYFTRLLLDHIFLIFSIDLAGETTEEKNLYSLATSKNFFSVTVLYNKLDILFDSDHGFDSNQFLKFKNKLNQNLRLESNVKLLYVSMKIRGIQEYKDDMIKHGIVLRSELKDMIFNDILKDFCNGALNEKDEL